MERFIQIEKANLKHNLLPYIIIVLLMCVLSPLFMGVKNLDERQTAVILEVYISLFGIILLLPVFTPDYMYDIRQLIRSKKTPMIVLYILRYAEALVFLIGYIIFYLFYLKSGACEFSFFMMFYGGMANCVFLGGLGLIVYSIIDNIAAAYMIPVLYYILSYVGGAKILGKFHLFTMIKGSFIEKKYLMTAGIVMTIAAFFYRYLKYKHE